MTTIQTIIKKLENVENQTTISDFQQLLFELSGINQRKTICFLYKKHINGNEAIIFSETDGDTLLLDIAIIPSENLNKFVSDYESDSDHIFSDSTGTIGIRGLIEIKNQFLSIITWARQVGFKKIECIPSDEKREKAYRFLKKIGFTSECEPGEITSYIIEL